MNGVLYPIAVIAALAAFLWVISVLNAALWARGAQRAYNGMPLEQALEYLGRPGLRITPSLTPTASKFGGAPQLPANLSWPRGESGPLRFIAKISLDQTAKAGRMDWLPDGGALHVFADLEFLDEQAVRVLFSPGGETEDIPRNAGNDPGRSVEFHPVRCPPSLEWLGLSSGLAEGFQPDPELLRRGPRHFIGGYPDELQGGQLAVVCERLSHGDTAAPEDMASQAETERASAIWRLLFQFDDDRDLGLDLSGGRLFVFIREQDARAGIFDGVITIWQLD